MLCKMPHFLTVKAPVNMCNVAELHILRYVAACIFAWLAESRDSSYISRRYRTTLFAIK